MTFLGKAPLIGIEKIIKEGKKLTKDYELLETFKKDINNEIDYIKNTVIPEIGNQIDANNAEIRRIEEEERRRREEEERRRKEEENKKKSNSSVTSGWR